MMDKSYYLVEAGWKNYSGFVYETTIEHFVSDDVSGFSIFYYISEHYSPEVLSVLGVDDICFTLMEEHEDSFVEYVALWLSDVFDLSEDCDNV